MKKILILPLCIGVFFSFTRLKDSLYEPEYIAQLRDAYSSGDSKNWEVPLLDESVKAHYVEIGSLPKLSFPENNPYSDAKKELGKLLFFDPRLSKSKQISCANCHDPELAWADGRSVSFGHNRKNGVRNSPSVFNMAYHTTFFWDGRASTLESQAMFPLTDPVEMASHEAVAVKHIKRIKGYRPYFKEAFGDEKITLTRIFEAIATYERTIVSGKSKFDRFISGDKNLFTDEEVLGLHLFRTKARCINCHFSPLFSDQQFHNLGLSYYGRKHEDLGRYKITKDAADVGRFKTASLREVARTAPYMHNGLIPSLDEVIQMYDAGMARPKPRKDQENDPLFPTTDPLLQKLSLTKKERAALKAFLLTLNSPAKREKMPELP